MIRSHNTTVQRATALIVLISAAILAGCGSKPQSASSSDVPLSNATEHGAAQPTTEIDTQAPTTQPIVEPTTAPTAEPTQEVVELATDPGAVEVTPTAPAAEIPLYDSTELSIIAAINQYRVLSGLWPLRPNDDLRTLAHLQADYLASLPDIPWDNLHADASGNDPMTRAAQHGWPTYNPQAIAIGENAYIGASIDAAMTWWKGSDLHNRTMLSVGYREIGVGVAPTSLGSIMIVVFGSRPGVLPALFDPASGLLYLSSERYKWSANGSWIHDVTEIAIPEHVGQEPEWSPWRLTVAAPTNRSVPYQIKFTDGTTTLEEQVDPRIDIAWLPSTVGLNGVVPEVLPAPSEPPNINIVYNGNLLQIVNIGREPLNLFGLDIAGSGYLLSATAWNNADLLRFGLDHLQAGTCLQVHRYDIVTDMTLPAGCTYLELSIYLMPDKLFWANADFDVRYNGVVLNVCKAGQGVCPVSLPTE